MNNIILVLLLIILLSPAVKGSGVPNKPSGLETIDYFSSDYLEARRKFLDAAHVAGANIESFKHNVTGPKGDVLFLDVALIGPSDANTVLVIGSGTHGVEGFSGSAIQTGLLSEGVFSTHKLKLRIILIHAINPYGFAHLRRFNEDNVDINRNFTDYSRSCPVNTGYEKLAEAISPDSISFWSNIKSIFKLYRYRLTKGNTALKKAITGGQYTHSQGLFYGGQKETWSNTMIRKIVKRYLSTVNRVVYIDVHTGLGEFGKAQILIHENENSSACKRAIGFWGDYVQSTRGEKSDFVYLQTSLKQALPEMLPSTEITAVTLEFGTISSLKVFWALQAENWLFHYGGMDHPKAQAIKTDLLCAFYPDDDEWKHKVWAQGREIVTQALQEVP